MSLVAGELENSYKYEFSGAVFLIGELWLSLLALGLGFFAAILPAFGAYKVDISETLGK
jgi:putative ABC transport system permease protein